MGVAETDVDSGKIDEKTIRLAQHTVAQYATDTDDLAMLLDMLGLRSESVRPKPVAPNGTATCPRGHRRAPDAGDCPLCEGFVPVDDLHMLVERIVRDTGMSASDIARRISIKPRVFTSALAPSKRGRRVRRGMYAAVLRLAEELSA